MSFAKTFIKQLINVLAMLIVAPLVILFFTLSIIGSKDSAFTAFSQLLSLFPGHTGSYLRKNFFRICMQHCSINTYIGFATIFSQQNTRIEDGVYIGPQCNIGMCHIGANTLLGSGVHIMSGKKQHDFSDLETPVKDQGGKFEQVSIGEDCWVGNGTLIMANIGKKCVIGAGSVVTQDIPDFSIAAGNPAVVIRQRK